MFTGIVEELGHIEAIEVGQDSCRLSVACHVAVEDASHGSSIAVNGVCLTVVDCDAGGFTADVMAETLHRTTLGALAVGSPVNLERPLPANGRLGGHIVQGHVDGTGRVDSRDPGERWDVVRITLPPSLAPYVVEKGSIAVDGVSLTVSAVDDQTNTFAVSLIPTTLQSTTLGATPPGAAVNLEVDILAKYVERLLPASPAARRSDR